MTPLVSVVVTAFDGEAALTRCIAALGVQSGAPPHEVLVEGAGATRAAARAAGARKARAEIVAFLDSVYVPGPAWLSAAAMLATLPAETAAVGGPVATDRWGYVSGASYLLEYAALMPPISGSAARGVAAGNMACRRAEAPGADADEWAWLWQREQQAAGRSFLLAADMKVELATEIGLRRALAQRHATARSFGATRLRNAGATRRTLQVLLAPVVAIASVLRCATVATGKGQLGRLIPRLPIVILLALWGAAGEASGAR